VITAMLITWLSAVALSLAGSLVFIVDMLRVH
jgi:hypothetical protein